MRGAGDRPWSRRTGSSRPVGRSEFSTGSRSAPAGRRRGCRPSRGADRPPRAGRHGSRPARRRARSDGRCARNGPERRAGPRCAGNCRSAARTRARATAARALSGFGSGAKVSTGDPSRSPGSRNRPGVQSENPASPRRNQVSGEGPGKPLGDRLGEIGRRVTRATSARKPAASARWSIRDRTSSDHSRNPCRSASGPAAIRPG